MTTRKLPNAEVRLRYPRYLEIGLIVALLLVITAFVTSRRFDRSVTVSQVADVVLKMEEIPVTQQVKRPPPPARPSIPVEDPDASMEDDLPMLDVNVAGWINEAPPAPPSLHEEIVDIFIVEVPPVMIGGGQALYDYMVQHKLYPKLALTAQVEGTVMIEFVVGTDGLPRDVVVNQERPAGLGFGETGVQAVSAMRFTPGQQRDRVVAVRMQQHIQFKLH